MENFPTFPELEELNLNGNELTDADLKHIQPLKSLLSLSLGQNKISSVDEVAKLGAHLPNLENLEIEEEAFETEEARKKLFGAFKALSSLNGLDKEGNELNAGDYSFVC